MAHPGGRPPHYETPELLEEKVNEYFTTAKADGEPITITGLVLHLGFVDRQSLYDYGKREEFSGIIKKARTLVENSYEKRLAYDKPTGAIFALKNMGWNDAKQEETPDGEQVKDLIIKAASAIVYGSK